MSSIIIDLTKLGYVGTAHLLIKISPLHDPPKTISEVSKISKVIIASTAIGDYEGYAVVVFKTVEELYNKILDIKKIQGIVSVEFFLSIPGFKYFPPSKELNK